MSDKDHPHADLMLLYAQRSRENVREYENWQCRSRLSDEWRDISDIPVWLLSFEYRLRPVPPAPMVRYAVVGMDDCIHCGFKTRKEAVEQINRLTDQTGYTCRIIKFVEVLE